MAHSNTGSTCSGPSTSTKHPGCGHGVAVPLLQLSLLWSLEVQWAAGIISGPLRGPCHAKDTPTRWFFPRDLPHWQTQCHQLLRAAMSGVQRPPLGPRASPHQACTPQILSHLSRPAQCVTNIWLRSGAGSRLPAHGSPVLCLRQSPQGRMKCPCQRQTALQRGATWSQQRNKDTEKSSVEGVIMINKGKRGKR